MGHIGRLCVGWFLISDLGLDWRMGGEWFESILIDYEPTLNWFNWVYACLEPMDPKKAPRGEQQCLEILEASIVHDPDAVYIKRWIPELSLLPTVLAREPWRLSPRGLQWAPKTSSLRQMPFLPATTPFLQSFQSKPSNGGGSLQLWRGLVSFCLPKLRALVSACLRPRHRLSSPHAFRYGVDYPEPVIQPVSLMHAESAEASVRRARAISKQQREEEVAWLAKSRRETGPRRFKTNLNVHKALRGAIKR